MSKITLTFVLIMTLNLNLISSIRDTFEQKKLALILPANYSKFRHEITGQKLLTRRKAHKNQVRVAFDSTP